MALSKKELKEQLRLLKEQAAAQQEINSGLDAYIAGLNKAKALNKTIADNEKKALLFQEEILDALRAGDATRLEEAKNKLQVLNAQTDELLEQKKILIDQLKEAKKLKMTFTSMGAGMVKNFHKVPDFFKNSFGKLKSWGLFEMDKSIKQSSLEMGLLGGRAKTLSTSIRETALSTNEWGMGVKELAKLQSSFSEELGRSVLLGNEGTQAISAMAAATTLGVEGAAKLTAEFEQQGYSAERTAKYIEDTLNNTSKIGINSSKVVKNIQNNMKMLNKYNFKGGVKGLAKMAQTVSKLGVDMNFASNMAEKLFDIDGAVEMSAQLQVLGGSWAKMSDPFHLMYMARNDMAGLTEEIGKAAESSAIFNSKTGEFDITSLEMHRLRKIAEQTGIAYEDLAQAGKNAAKFTKIKKQLSFSIGGGEEGKEMQEFLTNTAQLDEKGNAFIIDVKGDKKLIKDLGISGQQLIKSEMQNKKTLAERAKAAVSFDEKITNLINMVKTTMLPIVDGIDQVLGPLIKDLFKNEKFKNELKELGKNIGELAKFGAGFVKTVAEIGLWLGPTGTLATVLSFKALGWLFGKANWILNGITLAQGFNLGTTGKGGAISNLTNMLGGKLGFLTKSIGVLGAGIAGWAAGDWFGGEISKKLGNKETKEGDNWGTAGAIAGGLLGLALAPFTGGASLALSAAAVGGGALLGSTFGNVAGDAFNQPTNDAIFNSPINDGVIPKIKNGVVPKEKNRIIPRNKKNLGKDFTKGNGVIQGGKITPIDNKDELLAMKPGGAVAEALSKFNNKNNGSASVNSGGVMRHEFGDIRFSGEIKLTSPGTQPISIHSLIDLSKDPVFIRNITNMIHAETARVINGGKN